MDAIDAYDPGRGVKFETYASPRIKGSMLDELRRMDWVPRLTRYRAHQMARATASLEDCFGRKPTDAELAEKLDIDTKELHRLMHDAEHIQKKLSLSVKFGKDNGEKDMDGIDIVSNSGASNPYIDATRKDLRDSIIYHAGLTRAERLIVTLYYYEEMTMKDIGVTLDLSESRVSQMHSSIIDRLKAILHGRQDEFEFREPRYSNAPALLATADIQEKA